MSHIEKERLIKDDLASIENRVRHAFNQGYDLGYKTALKQAPTPKNDLGVDAVSRQEVLYLIADYDLSMGQVVKGIHALPSVTPQEPRWIPIDERLPEINEEAYSKEVLLSLRATIWDIDARREIHITAIGYYNMNAISSDGVYLDTEGWILDSQRILPLSDVIAWMPLPSAYKEIEDADTN